MKVLVACEHSGVVREAFRKLGHNAWSCDLLPASDGSEFHYEMIVENVLYANDLDLMIAHPPCTLRNVASAWALKDPDFEKYPGIGYHQKVKPETLVGAERREAKKKADKFFRMLLSADVPKICIENPIGILPDDFPKADQTIQPYEFGDDASKATCLWLKGLPRLVADPAKRKAGRLVIWNGKQVERWSNQTDSGQSNVTPSKNRGHLRSITYPGIAQAMAEQWSIQDPSL